MSQSPVVSRLGLAAGSLPFSDPHLPPPTVLSNPDIPVQGPGREVDPQGRPVTWSMTVHGPLTGKRSLLTRGLNQRAVELLQLLVDVH